MHATLEKPRLSPGAATRNASMPCLTTNDVNARAFIDGYQPAIDPLVQSLIALGEPLSAEQEAALPASVNVSRPPTEKKRFIYALHAGPFLLPPEAHDALIKLEPGVHRFHEIEAFAGGASLGRYFLQLESPVVDCVDLDHTVFRDGRSRAYFDEMMAAPKGPAGGPPRVSIAAARVIALSADKIRGRHWWRVPREFSNAHFCSDELRQSFSAAKVAGLQFSDCQAS